MKYVIGFVAGGVVVGLVAAAVVVRFLEDTWGNR